MQVLQMEESMFNQRASSRASTPSHSESSKLDLCRWRGKVVAIEVHDFVPGGNEVAHEFLPCVVARVDLRERAELGVRTKEKIDAAGDPLALASPATVTFECFRGFGGRPPLRVHVEQIDEEVIGQRAGTVRENADIGRPRACAEDT